MDKSKNYRKWSFIILILVFIIDLIVIDFYIEHSIINDYDMNAFFLFLKIIGFTNLFLLITGIILTVLFIKNKEKKDFMYYIPIIGYLYIIVKTIIIKLF